MSHSSPIVTDQQHQTVPLRTSAAATILISAAIIVVTLSLLMTSVLNGGSSVAPIDDTATNAPVLPAVLVAPHGTGVPDASTVFASKEFPTEEPAPTF